jgi:hypothetical protein
MHCTLPCSLPAGYGWWIVLGVFTGVTVCGVVFAAKSVSSLANLELKIPRNLLIQDVFFMC